MGAVHQTFGGIAGEYPAKFGNFRNVGLAVENGIVGVKPEREPGGGNFAGGLVHQRRVVAFDKRVKVCEEIK